MIYHRAKSIEIDNETCVGCRKCVDLCFVDTLRFDAEKKRPYVAYIEDCEGCMVCESNCPAGALTVYPIFPIHVPDPFC